ncbi:MAG: hypothetical protein HOJ57_29440 [Lentisphaerae bacterium]|jgi:hypothetical protein|nr:hypothetical protein [Lentisphaerota bacterium]MBT5610101.1 hypothetical protein [Lentisphaerota bacterium]
MFQFRAQFRPHELRNIPNDSVLWLLGSGTVPELKRNWLFQFRASSAISGTCDAVVVWPVGTFVLA